MRYDATKKLTIISLFILNILKTIPFFIINYNYIFFLNCKIIYLHEMFQ